MGGGPILFKNRPKKSALAPLAKYNNIWGIRGEVISTEQPVFHTRQKLCMQLFISVLEAVHDDGWDGIFLKTSKLSSNGQNRTNFPGSINFSKTLNVFLNCAQSCLLWSLGLCMKMDQIEFLGQKVGQICQKRPNFHFSVNFSKTFQGIFSKLCIVCWHSAIELLIMVLQAVLDDGLD